MHVYTSVLTSDEVKNLVAKYAIPLDLHPCVPPSGRTMNRLPADKIGIYDQYLKLSGVRVPFSTFLFSVIKHFHLLPVCLNFSSSRWPEVFLLVVEYENERVLVAKRKTQAAKDKAAGKRSATEGTSCCTKKKKGAPLTFILVESEGDYSTRTGSGTHHSASHLNTIILNDVDPATGGGSVVSESVRCEEDDGDHSIENVEDGTEADSPPVKIPLDPNTLIALMKIYLFILVGYIVTKGTSRLTGMFLVLPVSSSSGGSACLAFPKRNPGGDGAGSSLRGDVVPPTLFRSWFELGHGDLAQIDLLRWYEALNDDYMEFYESHRSCKDVSDRLTETQNQLVDVIRNRNNLADDHKNLQQEHLGYASKEAGLIEKLDVVEKEKDDLLDKNREQEERIKRLEEDLTSKTSSLTKAESSVSTLKGDLECLTIDLSHAKISLSDVFNQAIAAGWSEGVKVERTQEDAEAILAEATDYDPHCKDTFMSAFDSLFTQSYPASCVPRNVRQLAIDTWTHSEPLAFREMYVTWPLALGVIRSVLHSEKCTSLGLIRSVLRSRKCTSLGHWHLDSSGASCVSGNVCHLAIGSWTHPEHLAFREMYVTWPLALGLIRSVLRSEKCTSLSHWHLDSSGV
uniref:Transposase (Putative), gypsy type n=1 Tax=Tanacetum cinerariifolium TaxID=118510 RepID=A0A6L2N7X7_TANCI|nr:hypothetical protein [Tanacetum cinerariifolium]